VVRDLGDSVEFQRRTPFGISKWVSKKTDLNDDEKELLATYEAKRAAAANSGKTPESKNDDKSKQEKK
jgi:hypothetical protein